MFSLFAATLKDNLPQVQADSTVIPAILNTLYTIAGALAVIFIIVGAIRYIFSGGESSNISKAKSTIQYAIIGLILVILAFAITNFVIGAIGKVNVNSATGWKTLRDNVINTLLFVAGAGAVIMIIYGAFRYVTSGGNSSAVTKAKDTILFAVIGLIIAILAYAIVNFVVKVV